MYTVVYCLEDDCSGGKIYEDLMKAEEPPPLAPVRDTHMRARVHTPPHTHSLALAHTHTRRSWVKSWNRTWFIDGPGQKKKQKKNDVRVKATLCEFKSAGNAGKGPPR